MAILSFAILSLCFSSLSTALESVSVSTHVGQFNGFARTFEAFGKSRTVMKYLGIPYAEPPTGERRWQKPEPKGVFMKPYDATAFGSACLQLEMNIRHVTGSATTISFSEDCLFLNIYAPSSSQQHLPVIVYFHGGGFNMGLSNMIVADTLSVVGNVIVVTVNYRLNIWGFLSTGDEHIPGNFGLWDQQLALKWVHENIVDFGGDPWRVTVSGNSAGAASTIFQSTYPGNKGLFQRAYAISGSITCPWAFNADPLKVTAHLAELAGCTNIVTTRDVAACLKSKSSEEMYALLNNAEYTFIKFPMEFLPVVDDDFIKESPEDILSGASESSKAGQEWFASLDFMTGITDMEGLLNISPFVGVLNYEDFSVTREEFEHVLIPEAIRIMYGDNVPEIVRELVVSQYTDWSDPNDPIKARQQWLEMMSDYVFKTQIDKVIKFHKNNSKKNSYLYNFDAFPSQHLLQTPSWANKPNHCDDLTFLFGHDKKAGFTMWTMSHSDDFATHQWEYDLSKAYMIMISNFATSGNPNEPVDIQYFTKSRWPAFKLETQLAFNISREMPTASVQTRLYAKATNFWNTLIPSVIKQYRHAHSPSSPFVPRDDRLCDATGKCNVVKISSCR